MTSNRDNQPGGGGLLVAAGAGLLLIACCAGPALIAGGALAGIGGFLRSPWVIAAGVLLVVVAVLAVPRRHKQDNDCCEPDPSTNESTPGHARGEDR
jgi:mercuric ion transport protein